MPSDGDIARKSSLIMSIAARPDSSTSVWVTLARNAACVLLNTAMSAMHDERQQHHHHHHLDEREGGE